MVGGEVPGIRPGGLHTLQLCGQSRNHGDGEVRNRHKRAGSVSLGQRGSRLHPRALAGGFSMT